MSADNIIIILKSKKVPLDDIPVSNQVADEHEYRVKSCSMSALTYFNENDDKSWSSLENYNNSARDVFKDYSGEVFHSEDEAYESVEDDYSEYGITTIDINDFFDRGI